MPRGTRAWRSGASSRRSLGKPSVSHSWKPSPPKIAHEVRYPTQLFLLGLPATGQKKPSTPDDEEIDIGCEEVERLEKLVSGLRRIAGSRIERRSIRVVDLAARVEALLRDVLGARHLVIDVPADAALRCDPHQATQLLVNLVANAVEATAPSGHLGVEWAATHHGVMLAVWDNGPGFQGEVSRLFAPWFTTKPRGTGLGLAITQRIVRAHGWTIDAGRVSRIRTRYHRLRARVGRRRGRAAATAPPRTPIADSRLDDLREIVAVVRSEDTLLRERRSP